ncbi:MAG: caspase family protein [Smithellaceae bacterium]
MKKISLVLILSFIAATWGCATLQVRNVDLCENKKCDVVQSTTQRQELLGKLYTLLKNNLNREIDLYKTEPEKRDLMKRGLGFYLQGGPMPGWATIHSIKFTEVLYIDRENFEIKFKVDPDMTWNGTPVFSTATEGTLTVKENNQIKYETTYFVSWMVVGTSAWKHEMMFDYIDLDKNLMGSFYSIGGGGPLCAGGGDGYTLAKFPESSMLTPAGPTIITLKTKDQSPGNKQLRPPLLEYKVSMAGQSGNQDLEGGKEAALKMEITNNGEDVARDVQVLLSGYPELVSYFGEKHALGDINARETKVIVLKAILPVKINSTKADINVEVKEGRGFSPAEKKSISVSRRPAEVTETVEVISQLPKLAFTTQLKDQNNNRILDGGEEVTLKVDINNTGNGMAKDVQVLLSGHKELVSYLGEKRFVGNIKPGEQKTAEFKTILPAQIPAESANLRIEIIEGSGFSPSQRKTLQIAMRPADVAETLEIISEVDVDDIPPRIKGYERKDAVALIIGIGKYREEKIPAIKYAVRDAEVMAKYLENLGGIPKTNIQVLTDDKASKSDIQAYIEEWLPRRINENSTVFIYYAGHGAPGDQGKDAYIVPYEGQPDFPSQLYPLQSMYDSLGKLKARQIVVMLDSCFSGAKGRSVTNTGARPLVMNLTNILPVNNKVIVIAGATGSQISSDYDRAKHGLFTYYLLRGLRGEADKTRAGSVELGGLYNYVKTNVAEKASLELNRDQTPILLSSEPKVIDQLRISVVRTR